MGRVGLFKALGRVTTPRRITNVAMYYYVITVPQQITTTWRVTGRIVLLRLDRAAGIGRCKRERHLQRVDVVLE